MVFFNYALRKLNAKIVYYGPGLCGKTTNLQWIHDHFEGGQRGKMISLATEGDRTIFFDLLPIDIGSIRGMDVTLQLYTVPGQVHYNSTRQLVLRGADGVVFVADSQRTMKSSNVESYENLQENLMLQGIDLKDFPHALQFNKRDLRDLLSTEDLNESLNVFSVPIFEAIATEGIGVQETLEGIVKLVMRNLREKYEPVASASGPQAPQPMQVTGPTAFKAPEQPAAPAPSFVAPAPEPPPTVDMSLDSTPEAGTDSGIPAFQDEDGISTAVYEEEEVETASQEPAFESPDFGDKRPVFTPEVDTAAKSFEPEKTEDVGALFTDPRDEDGTSDDQSPAVQVDLPEVSEVPDVPDVPEALDVRDVPDVSVESVESTEMPEIVSEDPQPEIPEESMEDLFETEVPSVKSFVERAMGGLGASVESATSASEEDAPASVDLEKTLVRPPDADRYEDRIEAPGPFAPAPTTVAEEPVVPPDVSETDDEAVHAEVRQALGASEDREALASLSVPDGVRPDHTEDVLGETVKVEPVVSPPPEEPPPVVAPTASEEAAEPVFAVDEPEIGEVIEEQPKEEESVWEPEPIEVKFEAPASDETAFAEPEVEETPAVEPVVEEPVVDEPVVEEPFVEEPIVPDQVTPPPPAADDSLEKSQPIIVGLGDPFAADDEVEAAVAEVIPEPAAIISPSGAINVTAQDNQLHLALKGSGAIAEIGDVRALDLEVPVPGQWVGNRKVTLQLRLTLTPAEDEDG